jgi:MFS family permease
MTGRTKPNGAEGGRDPDKASSRRAHYALFVLSLAYVCSFVDRQILSLLIGAVRADLGISDFQVSLLQGAAFALFYVFLGLPAGQLVDRHARTRIVAAGVALWSVFTMLCGTARSFGVLFVMRMGVGIGEATLSPGSYSLLSDSFPPARLARALCIFTIGGSLGSGLSYIVGGSVAEWATRVPPVVLPYLGALQPWQLAFMIVGLPGLAVAGLVLTIAEPPRRGPRDIEMQDAPSIGQTIGYILKNRRVYGPLFVSISMLAILGYGTLNWYPSFLMRTYGLSIGQVGWAMGLLYILTAPLGALGSAFLCEKLEDRGYPDASLRVVFWVSLMLIVPAVIGPLMPGAGSALALAVPTVFLLHAFHGISIAAIQIVTPNERRGVVSACFLLATNISGLIVGTSLIALLTDFVFEDDLALRYSLALVAICVCPIAAFAISRGFGPYRLARRIDG